jgi:hypothetical protein
MNMKRLSLFAAAAILVFLGSTLPVTAGTCSVVLTKAHQQDFEFCNVTSGPGNWVFTIAVSGKVGQLGFHIKNSTPGAADLCWVTSLRQPKGNIVLVTDPIPAAAPSVCGTDWPDTNGAPLSVFAFSQIGDRNAQVSITVDYPDP